MAGLVILAVAQLATNSSSGHGSRLAAAPRALEESPRASQTLRRQQEAVTLQQGRLEVVAALPIRQVLNLRCPHVDDAHMQGGDEAGCPTALDEALLVEALGLGEEVLTKYRRFRALKTENHCTPLQHL